MTCMCVCGFMDSPRLPGRLSRSQTARARSQSGLYHSSHASPTVGQGASSPCLTCISDLNSSASLRVPRMTLLWRL